MKKIIAVIAALVVMSGAAFAQDESSGGDSWIDNLRVEADAGLGLMTFRIDARAAYRFPISDILAWDAGLGLALDMQSFLGAAAGKHSAAFQVTPFASFWFWDFYVSYGFGFSVNGSDGFFIDIADFRIGWQPNFRKTDKGFLFKIELGLLPGFPEEGKIYAMEDYVLTLGTSYKF